MKGRRRDGELVALKGGPWNGSWLWRDDLDALLATERWAEGRGFPYVYPRSPYSPTDEWISNPDPRAGLGADLRGRVWKWSGGSLAPQRPAA